MSAIPDSEIDPSIAHSGGLSRVSFAVLATVVATLGLSAIWPAVLTLWHLWTTDALKSIGMMIPLVSLILILRVWRTLGWQTQGTWWGLLLLLIAIAAVWTQQRAVLLLVVLPHWTTPLPPPSLVLFTYGSGVVLLLGGVRLYRAALFPIILLLFANPVPHVFSLWVDLPLQSASAYIARAFAMHLGQPLTPDHLRLMFTPDFGMFIAPGCNGIRGSVTMGFIALIAGYIYRFRWYTNALFVIGAILLGYVFNLARLCLLVLYYLIALHFTALQDKAENADYLIGATLFLLATILLFTLIHRFGDTRNIDASQAEVSKDREAKTSTKDIPYAQLAVLAVLTFIGCASLVRSWAATPPSNAKIVRDVEQRFPLHLGNYTRVRSWNESLDTGPVVYVWAEYAPSDGGTPIAIGISPLAGWQHDTLLCHATRGEHPRWEGQMTIPTADVAAVNFSSAFYNDGVTRSIEASTQCSAVSCNEFATERTHFGFVYSRPDPKSLLDQSSPEQIPVLVRVESTELTGSDDAARQLLTRDLSAFLAFVRLDDLTRPYS